MIRRLIYQSVLLGIWVIDLNQTHCLWGATATVLVANGGLVFTPAITNIAANDSVIWSWSESNHSSTSGTTGGGTKTPDGLWDSGVKSNGQTFSHQFTSVGTFPYYCSFDSHAVLGMTGAVIVISASLPLTVSITNPASGTVLSAPANVSIQASATGGGSVTNVQFLVESTIIADITAAPFFIIASNLAAGTYTLSAVASDNNGAKATNAITIKVVTATMPMISGLLQSPPDHFQFSYTANMGLHYVVERAADLASSNWVAISTNTAVSDVETFTDTNATNSPAFYRVELLPNPQ